MGGCSAPNCSNNDAKGFRTFRFPSDSSRRAIWLQNCRRTKWKPTSTSRLCEVHFEDSQWESQRADGWKKLKPNAVPTIFNVPNPPRMLTPTRQSHYKVMKTSGISESSNISGTCETAKSDVQDGVAQLHEAQATEEQKKILQLENEVSSLKAQLKEKESMMEVILNEEQISALKRTPNKWSNNSVLMGLKFRFSLGIHGYDFLRSTNYPLPSISTINRRIQNYKPNFGVFEELVEPLKCKVEAMDLLDRICTLSIDEMEISGKVDFDKNKGQFFGKVTLGDCNVIGNHLTIVLARGVKSSWKQVIACEVTGPSTKGPLQGELIKKCIDFVQSCGLDVVAVTSDMGSNNRAMWRSLGVQVNRNVRETSCTLGAGTDVAFVPDVCHLLKNLKTTMIGIGLFLPQSIVEEENLPDNFVTGKYIGDLWREEVNNNRQIRLLHHLKRSDIEPTHFSKMNVGSAMRYFSVKTAAALELAVKLGTLPPQALTTAFFCRLICQWFAIVNARISKASVTCKNRKTKQALLQRVVDIFQNVTIDNGWKPLNTGMIMATLSLIKITEKLFAKGYKFVLLQRFTQDALENIFSQIRRKSGSSPSALQCLNALKLITVSHFVSDVRRSSYSSDSDHFLLDSIAKTASQDSPRLKDGNHQDSDSTTKTASQDSPRIDDANRQDSLPDGVIETVSPESSNLDVEDLNLLFNIGGSTTLALLKSIKCANCAAFLNLGDTENDWRTYVEYLSMGNLKMPNVELFKLIINCEVLFRKFGTHIQKNGLDSISKRIVKDIAAAIPECCDLKSKIVKHFFTVRCYAFVNFDQNTTRKSEMYGTSSKKMKY